MLLIMLKANWSDLVVSCCCRSPFINAWLFNSLWLYPAIIVALRDENRLISERMKHLFYEVPVIVVGGFLFELLGQSYAESG